MSSLALSKCAARSKFSSLRTVPLGRPCYRCPCSWSRKSSSSSSKRWQARQGRDYLTLQAKVQGLKSRAAFKLLEINDKYRLFRPGQVVVDLGYAPGSWSQIAVDRTRPGGRVIGIDVIPAQPPKGVSTIQGNFLSQTVQEQVKRLIWSLEQDIITQSIGAILVPDAENQRACEIDPSKQTNRDYDVGRSASHVSGKNLVEISMDQHHPRKNIEQSREKMVDIILSDMSEPWVQTDGFWKRSLSDPYYRMMNTSGMSFRDHAGSMDLCQAAADFALDVLKNGGHFICKFYQGSEDKQLEKRLKNIFMKVHREKPESSRNESKEAYFVALKKKGNVNLT